MFDDNTYPLATSSWDDDEYVAIGEVIASDRFTMGPKVREFEEQFAEAFGSRHAVMVNSGSSANLIAIASAVLDDRQGLGPGDEILVPAVSWATTYFPLQQYGLKLKFVDIDIDTLNMDLALAEEAITPKTKGVFAVNLLGNPQDFDRLERLADKYGLIVWEDNCESMGATFDGRYAGTFGQIGTFSTFFSHHISTMEGGMLLTNDEKLAQMMVSLRAHGWTRELPSVNHVFNKTGNKFDDLFRFVLPGYNVRPLEMSGALGIRQISKLPSILAGRRENAEYFLKTFAQCPDIRTQKETGQSSWFGFSLVLEGRLAGRRIDVVQALSAAGIEARPIVAGNFTLNPVMKYLDASVPRALPAADKIHVDGLFVGNHHFPIHAQIDKLYGVITDML
ncbi:DegT/DnrJ/EryC1/StrS aminotransferase [Arthrobacter crystallopoietes BAB-32]|uniref:DegT/DnrJ/EryC1/StrS aminotransferase n=1 Tax=Arthrobacter crystallopoietes BAB-32 TaxID=1246476 RepID=N1V7M9_9MICC|nr:DegT/DnrJ/EryC1/StrS family aminotransferase [Arthrobacter crystallopoietes]EMY36117.1 DegT/DnrJ/EryC1/StrS aminotransferase [Arthrobacter crystallopoietes BAB-32]